jgi:hypothetical protein
MGQKMEFCDCPNKLIVCPSFLCSNFSATCSWLPPLPLGSLASSACRISNFFLSWILFAFFLRLSASRERVKVDEKETRTQRAESGQRLRWRSPICAGMRPLGCYWLLLNCQRAPCWVLVLQRWHRHPLSQGTSCPVVKKDKQTVMK